MFHYEYLVGSRGKGRKVISVSCFEDFLYFCMHCLALISLPIRRASVCGFLHEANVAVDSSFSSLSLCDIVYWEKTVQCEQKKKVFIFYFKRGYCDTALAIRHAPLSFPLGLLLANIRYPFF